MLEVVDSELLSRNKKSRNNKKDPFTVMDAGQIIQIILDYSSIYDLLKNLILVSKTWMDKILSLLGNQGDLAKKSIFKGKLTLGEKDLTLIDLFLPKLLNEIRPTKGDYSWQPVDLSEIHLPEGVKRYLQDHPQLRSHKVTQAIKFPKKLDEFYEKTTKIEEGLVFSPKPLSTPVGSCMVDYLRYPFSLEELLFPKTNLSSLLDVTELSKEEFYFLLFREQVGQYTTSLKAFAPKIIILMAKNPASISNDFLLKKLNALVLGGKLSESLIEVVGAKRNLRNFSDDYDCLNFIIKQQPDNHSLLTDNIEMSGVMYQVPLQCVERKAVIMRQARSKKNGTYYGMMTNLAKRLEIKKPNLIALSDELKELIKSTLIRCFYSKAFISPIAIYVSLPEEILKLPQVSIFFNPGCSLSVLEALFLSGFQLTILEKIVMLEQIVGNILFSKLILGYEGFVYPDNTFLNYTRYVCPYTKESVRHKIRLCIDIFNLLEKASRGSTTYGFPRGMPHSGEMFLSPKRVRGESHSKMKEILYELGLILHLFNLQGVFSDGSWSFNKSHPAYKSSYCDENIPKQDPKISVGSQLMQFLWKQEYYYSSIIKSCNKLPYSDDFDCIHTWGLKHPAINNVLGNLGNYCIIESQKEGTSAIDLLIKLHQLLQMTIKLVEHYVKSNHSNQPGCLLKPEILSSRKLAEESALKKLAEESALCNVYDDYTAKENKQAMREIYKGNEEGLGCFDNKDKKRTSEFDQVVLCYALPKAIKEHLPLLYMAESSSEPMAVDREGVSSSCSAVVGCQARGVQPFV